MERTKRYKTDGGDTAWEEKRKQSYATSEVNNHYIIAEVNISPKISISAQPLKMALHKNPAMHGSQMVIFLHDSKRAIF